MGNQEGGFINRAPTFNGKKYVFCKVMMKTYIQLHGADVWDIVEEEYQKPQKIITKDQNMQFTCNENVMHALLSDLPE